MYYMGCCEDYLTCDIAFNVVMPLSHASTRGRYSRIEGVTGRRRLQAWCRVPRDAGWDPHPECLEHPTPPEVLPMKQGPVPVKVSARDTLT